MGKWQNVTSREMDYSPACDVCHSETGGVLESCCILLSPPPSSCCRTVLECILQGFCNVELKHRTDQFPSISLRRLLLNAVNSVLRGLTFFGLSFPFASFHPVTTTDSSLGREQFYFSCFVFQMILCYQVSFSFSLFIR